MRKFSTYANRDLGCWGFWLFGRGVFLKAPRYLPRFSERHGCTPHFPVGGGWRVSFERSVI